MPDEADIAQAINEQHLQDALADHARRTGSRSQTPGPRLCADCEEPIPEKRRAAVPGCTRCIDCQTLHENWRPL